MDPLTMMMLGSTALSGIGSFIGGNKAAHAAELAAQKQSDAEERAAIRMRNAGDAYRTELGGYAKEYDPYVTGGQAAYNRLQSLVGLNGPEQAANAYQASPGYQFQLDQGLKALDRSAAARGYLNSGRNQTDVIKFAQGNAAQDYNDYFNKLSTLNNQGYAATGAKTGLQSQGSLGNLNANLGAEQLMFKNASTVPQGDIAAANSINQGLTGALGAVQYGVGQFQGQNNLQQILNSRNSSYAGAKGSPFSYGAGGYTGEGPFI